MADETPVVQNKGMLIVALVLGILVVLIYNWQIAQVREEIKGETVFLFRVRTDFKQGATLSMQDLEPYEVGKNIAESLGPVVSMTSPEDRSIVAGYSINQPIRAGETLFWSHIDRKNDPPPSSRITPGMVAKAIRLQKAPGDILRPGDLVNLLGRFPMRGILQPYRIIEGVKVVGVGGRTLKETPLPTGGWGTNEGLMSYREITIELTPEASLQMEMILAHVPLGLEIEVLPHNALVTNGGVVNVELLRSLQNVTTPPRN